MNPKTIRQIHRRSILRAADYQHMAINEDHKSRESADCQVPTIAQSHTNLSLLSLWWQEVLACVLVIAAFAAILVTLVSVNHKTLPKLPFHISVNTLIAIFAAVLKLAAAFVLVEGISQSKWSWYTRPRHLYDFQVYDNASRGPWGAFKLLCHLRCRSLVASLGAFVTIAATLVDPLSQQLIKIHDCTESLSNEITGLPRTRLFDEFGGHIGAAVQQMSTAFIGSLATGQFSSRSPQVPFDCPTGNCTFENEYSSVGYCSTCVDVSERIIFDNYRADVPSLTVRLTAPQPTQPPPSPPPSLPPEAPQLTQTSQAPAPAPYILSFIASAVGTDSVQFAMTYFDGGVDMLWFDDILWFDADRNENSKVGPHAHAIECSFDPCIHTFDAEIVNGMLSEKTIQRGPVFSWDAGGGTDGYYTSSMVDLQCINDTAQESLRDIGYIFTGDARWLPYNVTVNPHLRESDSERYSTSAWATVTITTEEGFQRGLYSGNSSMRTLSDAGLRIVPSECIYQIHIFVPMSLDSIYFPAYFNESVRDAGVTGDAVASLGVQGPIVPTAFYSAGAVENNQNGTLENIQSMMQNITDSMTTYMRWHGNLNMSEPAPGIVHHNTVCIQVRWGYLASSASIVGLLLLFFVATVFQTRNTERFAASSTPISIAQPVNPKEARIAGRHNFKSSALATILHGLDKHSQIEMEMEHVGLSNTVSELEKFSMEYLVMLVLTEHGWKLSRVRR